jgi:uncharacterized protein (TIGR02996 family)
MATATLTPRPGQGYDPEFDGPLPGGNTPPPPPVRKTRKPPKPAWPNLRGEGRWWQSQYDAEVYWSPELGSFDCPDRYTLVRAGNGPRTARLTRRCHRYKWGVRVIVRKRGSYTDRIGTLVPQVILHLDGQPDEVADAVILPYLRPRGAHPERRGFSKAIIARPNDTTAWLVYADWLDDHDDSAASGVRATGEAIARGTTD